MNSIEFGGRLYRMREYREIPQVALGRLVGLSKSQISRYEGGVVPDTLRLIRICAALNCCISALTGPHPNGFDPRRCALENKHLWHKLDGGGEPADDERPKNETNTKHHGTEQGLR
jgi:transcriptional regulator with XRE-family HTH domain